AAREIFVLHDPHGDQELIAEIGMAKPHIAQRGQRPEPVPASLGRSVTALHAPQREQDRTFHLEPVFDQIERLLPFACLALALLNSGVRCDRIDVVAERLAVFRLPSGGRNDTLVRRDAVHGAVKGRSRDAPGLGVRPQLLDEFGERLVLSARRQTGEGDEKNDEGKDAAHLAYRHRMTTRPHVTPAPRARGYASETIPPP